MSMRCRCNPHSVTAESRSAQLRVEDTLQCFRPGSPLSCMCVIARASSHVHTPRKLGVTRFRASVPEVPHHVHSTSRPREVGACGERRKFVLCDFACHTSKLQARKFLIMSLSPLGSGTTSHTPRKFESLRPGSPSTCLSRTARQGATHVSLQPCNMSVVPLSLICSRAIFFSLHALLCFAEKISTNCFPTTLAQHASLPQSRKSLSMMAQCRSVL